MRMEIEFSTPIVLMQCKAVNDVPLLNVSNEDLRIPNYNLRITN